jgi:hypothetical protein
MRRNELLLMMILKVLSRGSIAISRNPQGQAVGTKMGTVAWAKVKIERTSKILLGNSKTMRQPN